VGPLPAPAVPLADDVVILRRWRESDAPALAEAVADPLIRRYLPALSASILGASLLPRQLGTAQRGRDRIAFAIAAAAEPDELLGGITLWGVDRGAGHGTVSYWVAASVRGRGVVTRALRLLVDWCLADLGLTRLEVFVEPENIRSQRAAERCGFVRERLLHSHLEHQGHRRDAILMALRATEEQRAHRGRGIAPWP
jgi:RimJ/RimL family protein N-acetyltransferase